MNRLKDESSPYLRQHADNPVDWYPWSDEAFAVARAEDRAILLSVGYSSCHWCHVMAHESFEDAGVAAIMNKHFVNIKVDREERPDVDAIYMEAVQAMSGQGGWPMTVFLTPEGKPFFGGTYFGRVPMAGRPSFVELLEAVNVAWQEQRSVVDEQADALRDAIHARTEFRGGVGDPVTNGQAWIAAGVSMIVNSYDKEWGGFGTAPKFPQTPSIDLLLLTRNPDFVPIVANTLDAMASGGIYDHLGGGFHRYSVDSFWMVPHFEKMLYDQALIARTYVDAYLVTGDDKYKQVATEIIEYVLRDLRAPHGGWYSAEDADSDGEEGVFYVWRPEEIDAAAGDIAAELKQWFGVTNAGNFEGSNILHRPVRGDLIRNDAVETARQQLFDARNKRVRPGLDDKVITEWNAMFIATLAYASGALQRHEWLDEALQAANFLGESLCGGNRWLRSWHPSGGAKQLAFSSDYAWLVEAYIQLAAATGETQWRSRAVDTAHQMLQLFWDKEAGALFTTGDDAERLIVRTKDLFDGATPSANSVAALALAKLAALTGRNDLHDRSVEIVSFASDVISSHPTAFAYMLGAVDLLSGTIDQVVIAGDHPDLVTAVQTSYNPRTVLIWGEPDESPLWQGRTDGAYVCQNYACDLPATDAGTLLAQLTGK